MHLFFWWFFWDVVLVVGSCAFHALPFETLEQRLNQAVKAQERTNQLLEFALRAGFEEDERTRGV